MLNVQYIDKFIVVLRPFTKNLFRHCRKFQKVVLFRPKEKQQQ